MWLGYGDPQLAALGPPQAAGVDSSTTLPMAMPRGVVIKMQSTIGWVVMGVILEVGGGLTASPSTSTPRHQHTGLHLHVDQGRPATASYYLHHQQQMQQLQQQQQ